MNSPSSNPSQSAKKATGKSDEEATGSETSNTASAETASSAASGATKNTEASSTKNAESTESSGDKSTKAEGGKDAIELLKADHREVEQLFSQFESAKGRQQRKKLIEKIAAALTAHTMIEEEIFYPTCREEGVEDDELDEAQVEHDTVKVLVSDLLKSSQDDDYYDAKVTVLSEYVKHHVGEEENPSDGIFARAKKAGIDMDQLGRKLQKRRDELMSDQQRLLGRPLNIRSLNLSQLNQEYGDMARYPTDRYRDEGQYGSNRSTGGGYRSSSSGSTYRGDVNYDDESRGSSISRGSRSEFYRGDYDEDYGPNRGAYGQSDYERSSGGYRDDDDSRQGYRSGYSSSEGGYGQSSSGSRGDYSSQTYGSSGGGARPGQRRIEQSASGGRYRLDYDQDEDSGQRSGAGRYLGGGEDREYYQGTRYGSSQGGGRYRTGNEDTEGYDSQNRDDRYYSGQGYGSTRGGDLGGRSAYGSGSDDDDGDYEGRGASIDSGRSGYGTGDYRRRGGSSSSASSGSYGNGGRSRYEGSGSGFRGNR